MNLDDDVENVPACILCPDADVSADQRFAARLGLRPPYAVQRCARCGLRWLSPRPTPAAYGKLYSYEDYFGGQVSVEDYATLAAQRRPYFAARIRRIEKVSGSRAALNILDIGAATGEFVHEARARGHNAVGIELSAGAREKALELYGIELLDADIARFRPDQPLDVVHMNHVFEHIGDPVMMLRHCSALLGRTGLLVMEVPQQIDNDLDRLKRIIQPWCKPGFNSYSLHHAYFYTPGTLTRLLETSGFAARSIVTSNSHRTPLWPVNLKNWLLRPYLAMADWLHQGGNIIEVYAQPASRSQESGVVRAR